MTLVTTVRSKHREGQAVIVLGTLVASVNYTTGGDPLDLSNLSGLFVRDPTSVIFTSKNGYTYFYDKVAKKFKVLTTANTELAGAPTAYPAGVTGDVIEFEAKYSL